MGAMVIFSLILLNVNRFLLNNQTTQVESELEYTGIAEGQNIIDAARILPFDKATAGGNTPTTVPDDFTSCGPGYGESKPSDFNDFDDYDGYTVTDTTEHGLYNISVQVCYVQSSNYNSCTSLKTTHKRMLVTVASPYLDNPIKLSFIKSYY